MGALEAEDVRDTRAGLDSWTRASLRPAGGQPPPVILDDGDVVRAADASVKQSLGVQQAPQRPARPAATAGSPGRHRRLAASTTNPGISPRLRLSHRPCLPASSGCTGIFSRAGISSPAASRLKMFSMEASLGSEPARPSSMEPRACLCGSLRLIIITSEAGAWAVPALGACRWSRPCFVASAGGGRDGSAAGFGQADAGL